MDVPLGPFAALAPLAKGGMGAVYRGVHREQGVPVAIKVIPGAHRASPAARTALREEVRAMARLDHPAIVRVLDHGAVDAAASTASAGAMEVGDGYIVMELAGGGSLSRSNLPPDFAGCAELLDTLLDGLAHAHAHGLIHRDLKPPNVLLPGRHDLRPGPKLTDFGISYATMEVFDELDPSSAAGRIVGTPLFMAPEQVRGRWRDFGPWTDLYAFGCLAWAVLTGTAPFQRQTLFAIAHAQMNEPPPPLAARVPVPDGVEDWLRRLLVKECASRYQSAAHVRRDLATLRGSEESPAWTPEPGTLRGIDVGAELRTVQARRTMTGRHTRLVTPFTATTSGFSEEPPIAPAPGVAAEGLEHRTTKRRQAALPKRSAAWRFSTAETRLRSKVFFRTPM